VAGSQRSSTDGLNDEVACNDGSSDGATADPSEVGSGVKAECRIMILSDAPRQEGLVQEVGEGRDRVEVASANGSWAGGTEMLNEQEELGVWWVR
jgi:hypothetical protein